MDYNAVIYLYRILELCLCVLVITTLCIMCCRFVRFKKKQEKYLINIFEIVLVAVLCLVLGIYGMIRLLDFKRWLIIYVIGFLVVTRVALSFMATLYREQAERREQKKIEVREQNRMKTWKQKQEAQKSKTQILGTLLRPHLQDIKLGYFGTFPKDKIGFGYILEDAIEHSSDTAAQVNFVMEKVKVWELLVANHVQYIINYFMAKAIENTYATDTGFWETYLKDGTELSNEKCLAIFHEKYDEIVKNELNAYLTKDTTKDMKELFQKHFPFFDYDNFIAGIKLEQFIYGTHGTECFAIQLSDKNFSVFCSASEEFDKDLEGREWHNF